MDSEFAGIIHKFLKFKKLKLDGKRRILYFKRPRDFSVRNKLVNYPIGFKYYFSLSIGCFKLVTAVFLLSGFSTRVPPSLPNNFRFDIRLSQKRVKVSRFVREVEEMKLKPFFWRQKLKREQILILLPMINTTGLTVSRYAAIRLLPVNNLRASGQNPFSLISFDLLFNLSNHLGVKRMRERQIYRLLKVEPFDEGVFFRL